MADRASELRSVRIDEAGAGTIVLVAGEAGMCVSIVGISLSASGNTQVTILDGTGDLYDAYLGLNTPLTLPEMTGGWFTSREGEDVSLTIAAGVAVAGRLVYRMVPEHQRY